MIKYFCDYCGKQLQEREELKIRVPIPVERSSLIGGGWHCVSQDQLIGEECANKIAERLVDL